MQTITKSDFEAAFQADPRAFRGRWSYMGPVCQRLAKLPDGPALELGPYTMPMVPGCDTMDRRDYGGVKPMFLHDATQTPWPIEDDSYDVFVALQVLEHLGDSQTEVWREVCRVARRAIISIPWHWTKGQADHIGIDRERVSTWTLGMESVWTMVVPGIQDRRIYEFDLR